jgi:hypothetical protein
VSLGAGTRRVGRISSIKTGDVKVDRALDTLSDRVNALLGGSFAQAVPLEVELVSGLNKLGHRLGRNVPYFTHAALPTTGISIGSAQAENPRPDLQVWVRMTGVDDCKALLFLFPVVG